MKWEYKEDMIPKGDLIRALNHWGDMGWELCGFINEMGLGVTAIFKRLITL